MLLYIHLIMIYKRYEYWSNEGKKWTEWFEWNSSLRPEFQMNDKRIFCRLKNEYKNESIYSNCR